MVKAFVVAMLLALLMGAAADIFLSCASADPSSWFYSLFCTPPAGGGGGGAG